MSNASRVVVGFLIATPILFLVGGVFLGQLGAVTSTAGSATVTATDGANVQLADIADVGSLSVSLTQGNALELRGSGVTGALSKNITGNWTVTAYAELNTSATDSDAAYTVVSYDNATIMLTYDAGDWLGYYNSSAASGVVTVDAPSPGTGALLTLRWNGSELRLARNETAVNTTALTGAPSARNRSTAWHGPLDEVRVFGNAVPAARLQDWANEPVIPLEGQTRLARYLFDEGRGSTTTAWFTGTDVGIGSATWTTGLGGPGLDRGQDYEFSTAPLTFTVLTGGLAHEAPVVFVTWAANSGVAAIVNGLGSAIDLFVVAMIVVVAGLVVSQLR